MPYPTAPGHRIAWDDDGTVAGHRNNTTGGTLTEWTAGAMAELNDEDSVAQTIPGSPGTSDQISMWFVFPELRELDGIFLRGQAANQFGLVESSADTTNGLDGTWATLIAAYDDSAAGTTYDLYRSPVTVSVSSKRGVRALFVNPGADSLESMHLYGEISAGETPDRLIFIDELTGLQFVLPKDYGDIPRGSARDFEWRLKNNSTVAGNNKTINTIGISVEALYLNSAAWYTFSIGGDSFASTKSITSLAPEASSALIVCRQIIPVAEVLDKHVARIQATVGSLT